MQPRLQVTRLFSHHIKFKGNALAFILMTSEPTVHTDHTMPAMPAWSVVIIAARESLAVLGVCIGAAMAACAGHRAVIDVLVNGNQGLAEEAGPLVAALAPPDGTEVRLWFIAVGDKAHAWNTYVYDICQADGSVFFLDGYAIARPDAFRLLDSALAEAPDAMAATGVPSSGRSAAALRSHLLAQGGIHGNMHAISSAGIRALRDSGFRLPLGLYRTDGMLGAVLMFRCNPAAFRWDTRMILVHPGATWDVQQGPFWRLASALAAYRRKIRQAQGELENCAMREHLAQQRQAPGTLPATAAELVARWINSHRSAARRVFLRQPLTYYAAKKLTVPRDWRMTGVAPTPVAVVGRPSRTASCVAS